MAAQTSLFLATLALLSPASASVIAGTSPAPPRNALATRQTSTFVNFYKSAGCGASDFIVALTSNAGQNAGPDTCPVFQSLKYFAKQQQSDGSYKVFMKPSSAATWGGQGLAILRTPVLQVEEDYCGLPRQTMTNSNGCYAATLANTFMLQSCLKSQKCIPGFEERQADEVAESEVAEVAALERRDVLSALERRDEPACFKVSRGDYTVADTTQTHIAASAISCPGPESCTTQINFEQNWSMTVSVDVTAGVEGLFSASMGVAYTEGNSKAVSHSFTIPPASQGNVIWTPILTCKEGTATNCWFKGPVPNGKIKMCKSTKLSSGETNGIYSFLEYGRKMEDHKRWLDTLTLDA